MADDVTLRIGGDSSGAVRAAGDLAAANKTVADGILAAAERARQYTSDLQKLGDGGIKAVTDEHAKFGRSLQDLAKDFGVTEASLKRYFNELQTNEKAATQSARDAAAASIAAAKAQEDSAKKAADAAKQAAAQQDQLFQRIGNIGRGLTSVGTAMTAAFTVPIVGGLTAAASASIGFESSFAGVRKTLTASPEQFNQISLAIRRMAKEIPESTAQLSAIAATAGQMGVEAPNIEKFTRNVAALGVAVDGIDGQQAAMQLAQIGAVTKTSTTDIDKMASAVVNLGNTGNSTEGQILDFTSRLAGAGHQAGLTVQDIMAIGATMANLGINAEAGGTAFSTVIGNMSKAVVTGGTSLDAFARIAGKTADEFAATFKAKPMEAVRLFVDGLSTVQAEGGDLYAVLGDVGAEGMRMRDVLLRMSGASGELGKQLAVANDGWQSGNKHLQEAEKKYGTTANQTKVLWNNVKDLGITVGDTLVPALVNFVRAAQPVIDMLGEWAKRFSELPGWLQTAGFAFLGIVAAGGPLLIFLGKMAEATAALYEFRKAIIGLSTAQAVAQIGTLTTAVSNLTKVTALGGAAGVAAKTGGWGLALAGTAAAVWYGGGGVEGWNGAYAEDMAYGQAVFENSKQKTDPFYGRQRLGGKDINLPLEGSASVQSAASDASHAVDRVAAAVAKTRELTAAYTADLKKLGSDGLASIVTAHKTYGVALDKLAEQYGVHETTLERYFNQIQEGAKGKVPELKKKLEELSTALVDASKHHVPLNKQIEMFGDDVMKAVAASAVYATKVPENIQKFSQQMALEWERGMNAGAKTTGVALGEGKTEAENWAYWDRYFRVYDEAETRAIDRHHRAIVDNLTFERDVAAKRGASEQDLFAMTERIERAKLDMAIANSNRRFELETKNIDKTTEMYAVLVKDHRADVDAMTADWQRGIQLRTAEFERAHSLWGQLAGKFKTVFESVQTAVDGSFAQMLLGAKSWHDGMIDIWNSLKAGILNILNTILHEFLNRFLKGMLGALSGQQGAFSNAFAGLFGGGGGTGNLLQSGLGSLLGRRASSTGMMLADGTMIGTFGQVLTPASIASGATIGTFGQVLPGAAGAGAGSGAGSAAGAGAASGGGLMASLAGPAAGGLLGGLVGYKTGSRTKGALAGVATGAGVGALVGGPIGALIGGGVGAIGGFLGGVFGKSAGEKTNDQRDAWIKQATGIDDLDKASDALRAMAHEAGVADSEMQRLFSVGKVKDFEVSAKSVSDQIGLFTTEQAADAERLEGAMQRYGIAIDEAGEKWRNARLDDTAKELIEDWRVLVDSGISVTTVNGKMAESVSDYFNTAVRVGNEIPAAMQPILQSMVDQGTLVDANGDKISDLGKTGVQFAQTWTQGFDRVVMKLQELITKLQGTGQAIQDIPRTVDVAVNYRANNDLTEDVRYPLTDGRYMAEVMHDGGIVGQSPVARLASALSFRTAPRAHQGRFFGHDEVPAILQSGEGVLSRAGMAALGGSKVLAALNRGHKALGQMLSPTSRRGHGAGAAAARGSDEQRELHAHLYLDGREVARSVVPFFPGALREHGLA